MAEDWAADVRKYAPGADDSVIAVIVRYCGIALHNRDSALVSFSDKTETDRVRDNFCRKKLGLTETDAQLDAAIAAVGERMSGDTTRNRVTVYYLLAETFGKLGLFGAAPAPAAAAAPAETAPQPILSVPQSAPAPAPAPAPRAPARLADVPVKDDGDIVRTGLVAAGVLATILIGAGVIGTLIGQRVDTSAVGAAPTPAAPYAPTMSAPAVDAPKIPDGAGLVAAQVDGKPQVSVYFDTASADVTPDLANEIAALQTFLGANPTARLGVSGYNDPRGNAAFNAELSKNRARNVAGSLAALGLPADRIDLVKPVDTTDDTATPTNARRVDVYVQP